MSLPIVIIHKCNSRYLIYTIAQAKASNPQSKIYLIGDSSNAHYEFVEHHYIADYFEGAEKFASVYKHRNTNPYRYQVFTHQRWFILNDFMTKNNLNQCFYMDSDVMVYANLSEEVKKFKEFDITLSKNPSSQTLCAHCTFINNREVLNDFCHFLIKAYTEPSLFQIMESQYHQCRQNNLPGGACDMVAFREYEKMNYAKIGLTSIIRDNSIYDHSISRSDGFEMNNGMKNIYFQDNQPYCKTTDSGKPIRFSVLHFQGATKKHISRFFTGVKNLNFNYYLLKHYFVLAMDRVMNKLMGQPPQLY